MQVNRLIAYLQYENHLLSFLIQDPESSDLQLQNLVIHKSSSLFVDLISIIFGYLAAKPCKARGNKQTVHVYPNIN